MLCRIALVRQRTDVEDRQPRADRVDSWPCKIAFRAIEELRGTQSWYTQRVGCVRAVGEKQELCRRGEAVRNNIWINHQAPGHRTCAALSWYPYVSRHLNGTSLLLPCMNHGSCARWRRRGVEASSWERWRDCSKLDCNTRSCATC